MNLWCRGSLGKNPYVRNAFRVARVPRETVQRATIVRLIGQTKRTVNTDPRAHAIAGEPVTPAEVNLAEQLLLDPAQRIAEELLVHAAERPPLEHVRRLSGEAADALRGAETGPLAVTNFSSLLGWAHDLARQEVDQDRDGMLFGALELTLVPPFGLQEED